MVVEYRFERAAYFLWSGRMSVLLRHWGAIYAGP
jgi:hypothetical protein